MGPAVTPEERCERVRMALAEAGYPDAEVHWNAEAGVPFTFVGPGFTTDPPLAVAWRASLVVGEDAPCWPCAQLWRNRRNDGNESDCDHDPWTSPWPEVVR